MLSTYRDAQDLIQVGAYVAGSDPRVDLAVAAQPHIDAFLRQKVTDGSRIEDSLRNLAQLAALAQQQPQARGARK
jgi:flagellar biosynthesis/type III secretory pathway ATPase